MPFLNWDEKFIVNIREIDEQHKKLIELINKLHQAMSKGQAKEIIADTLTEMLAYTKYHFTTEENLMVKHNYFDRHAHRLEHEKFIEQANRFQTEHKMGKLLISVDVLTFLSNWVQNHIREVDKKYANYLNSQGVY